jgi:hypothetical protein
LLLTGNRECMERFVADDRFANTPWKFIFAERLTNVADPR